MPNGKLRGGFPSPIPYLLHPPPPPSIHSGRAHARAIMALKNAGRAIRPLKTAGAMFGQRDTAGRPSRFADNYPRICKIHTAVELPRAACKLSAHTAAFLIARYNRTNRASRRDVLARRSIIQRSPSAFSSLSFIRVSLHGG